MNIGDIFARMSFSQMSKINICENVILAIVKN